MNRVELLELPIGTKVVCTEKYKPHTLGSIADYFDVGKVYVILEKGRITTNGYKEKDTTRIRGIGLANRFKLLDEVSNKIHPHHDSVLAWLEGKDIEHRYKGNPGAWHKCKNVKDTNVVPSFSSSSDWRVKRENPNTKEIEAIQAEMDKLKERLEELKSD